MRNKKLTAMVVSVALVAIVGVGATLAYFTDTTDTKSNIVTMGKVDISLDETSEGEKAGEITEDGLEFDHVQPGDVLSKIPVVTVEEDSQDAYIRVMITASAVGTHTAEEVMACLDIDENDWVLGDGGYYYYQGVATAGDELTVFNNVSIPKGWGNEVSEESFTININAEATQADNFTPVTNGSEQIIAWEEALV